MRPQSSSSFLQSVLVVALLLLAPSNGNHYVQARQPEEYQQVKVVGGAMGRNSAHNFLRSGQARNTRQQESNQQYSGNTEYIRGRRVGKTLHVDLQRGRHETTEN